VLLDCKDCCVNCFATPVAVHFDLFRLFEPRCCLHEKCPKSVSKIQLSGVKNVPIM